MSSTGRLSGYIVSYSRRQPQLNVSNGGVTPISRCLSCSMVRGGKRPPREKPPGKLEVIVGKKYMGYIDKMGTSFKTRFPAAHRMYVLVKEGVGISKNAQPVVHIGIFCCPFETSFLERPKFEQNSGMKSFFTDTKTMFRVSTQIWKGKNQRGFTYRELEAYRQTPTDIIKVFPVLAIAALPFAPYIIFPLAYLFPRHLLCRHFWTPEQQSQFGEHYLRGRAQHFPKVLQYMDQHSRDVKDPGHRRLLDDIILKLEQKGHPTVEQLVEVRPVFHDDQPFGRAFLVSRQQLLTRHLALGMGFASWGDRLSQQALLVHNIDLALARAGVHSLTPPEIRQACFLRGLNAACCNEKEMLAYLDVWTRLGKHVDESTLSLLLHSPVFFAMNHPANASLSKPFF